MASWFRARCCCPVICGAKPIILVHLAIKINDSYCPDLCTSVTQMVGNVFKLFRDLELSNIYIFMRMEYYFDFPSTVYRSVFPWHSVLRVAGRVASLPTRRTQRAARFPKRYLLPRRHKRFSEPSFYCRGNRTQSFQVL